jgi:hypothetical protein
MASSSRKGSYNDHLLESEMEREQLANVQVLRWRFLEQRCQRSILALSISLSNVFWKDRRCLIILNVAKRWPRRKNRGTSLRSSNAALGSATGLTKRSGGSLARLTGAASGCVIALVASNCLRASLMTSSASSSPICARRLRL